jgi:hypothetical protein
MRFGSSSADQTEEIKPLRRTRRRWEFKNKIYFKAIVLKGVGFIYLTQKKGKRQESVNMAMNLRIS